MRFCANENVAEEAVLKLRQSGHDVLWIREAAPGITDQEVLRRSNAEKRLLLTFDKDFGELVYRLGSDASCGIILFRFSPSSAEVARSMSCTRFNHALIGQAFSAS